MPGTLHLFPRTPAAAWRLLWNAALDRLTDYLPTMTQEETNMADLKITAPENSNTLYMTRTFNAPRALVWKALSEPEHAVRWWGPHGHTNKVLHWDWRVGGSWRIETVADGQTIVFFGDYLKIEKPTKVSQTFSFDQLPPGMHSVDTVELIEEGSKTIYKASSVFPDVASRDGMLASGMETGVVQGFERLDAMLEDWKVDA